jgi:putative hemolysin
MSVLFRGALVAAALAVASITPAAAQKLQDGSAIVVTPKGEMVVMKHKHGTTVPPGYAEVVGHSNDASTAMIMVNGKMYMKSGVYDRDVQLEFSKGN